MYSLDHFKKFLVRVGDNKYISVINRDKERQISILYHYANGIL